MVLRACAHASDIRASGRELRVNTTYKWRTGAYRLVHPPGADEVACPRHPATQGGIAVLIDGGAVLVILPLEDHAFTATAPTETRARSLKLPIIL